MSRSIAQISAEGTNSRNDLAEAFRGQLGEDFEIAVFERNRSGKTKKFEIAIDHVGLPVAYVGFTIDTTKSCHYHSSNVIIRPQVKGVINASHLYELRQLIIEKELAGKPLAYSHHFLGARNAEMFITVLQSLISKEKKEKERDTKRSHFTYEDWLLVSTTKPELIRHAFELVMREWNNGSSDTWRRYPLAGEANFVPYLRDGIDLKQLNNIEVTNIRLCPPYIRGTSNGLAPSLWLKTFRNMPNDEKKSEMLSEITKDQAYLLCELVDIVRSNESKKIKQEAETKAHELAELLKQDVKEFDIKDSLKMLLKENTLREEFIKQPEKLLFSAEPENAAEFNNSASTSDDNPQGIVEQGVDPPELVLLDQQREALGQIADEFAQNRAKIDYLEKHITDAQGNSGYYLNPVYWISASILFLYRRKGKMLKKHFSDNLEEGAFTPNVTYLQRPLSSEERIREIALNNLYRLPAYQCFSPVRDVERIVEYPAKEKVKRILFICQKAGLGDVVHIETVTASLQARYPDAIIDIVSTGSDVYWKLKGNYGEVIRLKRKESSNDIHPETITALKTLVTSKQHDLIVPLNGDNLIQLLGKTVSSFPGQRTIIGYQQWNFTLESGKKPFYLQELRYDHDLKPVPNTSRPQIADKEPMPNINYALNFMRGSIAGDISPASHSRVELSPGKKDEVRARIAKLCDIQNDGLKEENRVKFKPETRLLLLNPFSSMMLIKDFPLNVYTEALKEANQVLIEGNIVVGINLPVELKDQANVTEMVAKIKEACPNCPVVLLTNQQGDAPSQEDYINFVLAADFVIGVDTSSRHLAASANIPSLTLFRQEGEMLLPGWTYQPFSSSAFQSQPFVQASDATFFITEGIKAFCGDSQFYKTTTESQGDSLRQSLVNRSEDLAVRLAQLSEEKFKEAFIALLNDAKLFTDNYLRTPFKHLADGMSLSLDNSESQIDQIIRAAKRNSSREIFVRQWLNSNIFFLLNQAIPVRSSRTSASNDPGSR